ncbi:putative nuclease HARBI1 [Dissostichus eleginoides]|uniref:Putative nuclease HARBI1 n=1 Tax=Dissostichus eleginoides TaxID=100907 RepID=A0AAD9F1P7_DISEL|nr:putative nuclease HARBI1 [Dissostichus eleginoides]
MGVHKTTVGEVVTAVSDALARLLDHFVSFPNDGQIAKVKQKFFLLGDMPNTIGVIDCTHVHFQAPHQREWEYINRRGRHSINVQLVGDADLAITNCVVRWPGQARAVVERTIGLLKGRWRCLDATGGKLSYKPDKVCQIVRACAVLHNLALLNNVPLPPEAACAQEEPDPLPQAFAQNPGALQQRLDVMCLLTASVRTRPLLEGCAGGAVEMPGLDAGGAVETPGLDAGGAVETPGLDAGGAVETPGLDAGGAVETPGLDAGGAVETPGLDARGSSVDGSPTPLEQAASK